MDRKRLSLLLAFALGLASVRAQRSFCDDIDTDACVGLEANRPDLCSDLSLATTVCPRHCNRCPLACYHCDTSSTGADTCNSTKQCATGELCMRVSLQSSTDNHAEHAYKCASKAQCDGKDILSIVGRRSANQRDVSVQCCSTDFCNTPHGHTTSYPTTTSPPSGCATDLIIAINEDMADRSIFTDVKQFLVHIINRLRIGPTETQVAVITFGNHGTAVQWHLNRYRNKPDLITAMNGLQAARPNASWIYDPLYALDFVAHHVINDTKTGNRPLVPDELMFISDKPLTSVAGDLSIASSIRLVDDIRLLHAGIHNIIVVDIGLKMHAQGSLHVATDSAHAFHVTNSTALYGIEGALTALFCTN